MMFVPLTSKGQRIGTLNLASLSAAQYSHRQLQIAQDIGDHLAVIVEHARLHEESKEIARLEERSRLAHEIHDSLAQSFIGIILELDLVERLLNTDAAAAKREFERARQVARTGLEEARRSVLALQPPGLDHVSLEDAVSRELQSLAGPGLAVRTSVHGSPAPAPAQIEAALFRITQEAVSNIRKHANASRVDAVLDYGPESIMLTISDNGLGFDPAVLRGAEPSGGFGLTSMTERVAQLGGDFRVESAPGRGTRLMARLPLETPATAPSGEERAAIERPQPLPAERPESQSANQEPRIRVLLADDHTVAREGIRRMLEEASNIEVVAEARDGNEALEKTRAHRPDVVLTDLRMPNVGGIELLEAIKTEGLDVQALILTAHLAGDSVIAGLRAGAKGYVLKDAGGSELVKAVESVSRGETYLPAEVSTALARRMGDLSDTATAVSLTPREMDALGLLAKGLRNKEIALSLHVSEPTVKFHVAHIYEKLGVGGRTEALAKALEYGLLQPP